MTVVHVMAPHPREQKMVFDNLLNFRDVCSTVNKFSRDNSLKSGLLFRSARPDLATSSDRKRLTDEYGIKTVIDLRTTTEHIEAGKKVAECLHVDGRRDDSSPSQATTSPAQIPGLKYAEINLNGKGFERHLVWQLSYWNLAKLAGLMAFGYRVEGIGVLGKNVLLPKGLTGLAQDTLDYSGPEIKQIFDILTDEASYPVLIHCTQGKDRTGLVVLLVLLLCDVDVNAISYDYAMSEQELEPEFEQRMKEISSIGLDETFARCAPDFANCTTQYLKGKYGGVEDYLLGVGVTTEQVRKLKVILQVTSSE